MYKVQLRCNPSSHVGKVQAPFGLATVTVGSLVLPYSTAHSGLMLIYLTFILQQICVCSWICFHTDSPEGSSWFTHNLMLSYVKSMTSDEDLQAVSLGKR